MHIYMAYMLLLKSFSDGHHQVLDDPRSFDFGVWIGDFHDLVHKSEIINQTDWIRVSKISTVTQGVSALVCTRHAHPKCYRLFFRGKIDTHVCFEYAAAKQVCFQRDSETEGKVIALDLWWIMMVDHHEEHLIVFVRQILNRRI